jgi:Ser/Thr protein kinase RdoA (MazF antagonist)
VHDTAGFLVRLGERAASAPADTVGADAVGLARDILIAAAELPELGDLPSRICHGDLKISNVVFRGPDAICLIDLDTLGMQSIAYEMGDALRSWCNPLGEDVAEAAVQRALLDAALDGYLGPAGSLLSQAEIDSIIPGMRMVCIELAARFCLDVFEDRYFGWDATRFASRREHNLVRARGQLSLGLSVAG